MYVCPRINSSVKVTYHDGVGEVDVVPLDPAELLETPAEHLPQLLLLNPVHRVRALRPPLGHAPEYILQLYTTLHLKRN